ncbi:MAG: preprotein translocase subunit SecG [Candidatus Pacebacteria bacterium]|nr:preprotein translocase subunit SecG [Candidatus Paceibacterota bacterium]
MFDIITGILFFLDTVCALLLIGIIMIQQSKGAGGLGAIAGGMGESVFGTAAGNIITKTTVVLASLFLGITLLLGILAGHRTRPESMAERLQREAAAQEQAADVDGDGLEKASELEPVKEGGGSDDDLHSDTDAVPPQD